MDALAAALSRAVNKSHVAKPKEFDGRGFKGWRQSGTMFILASKDDFQDEEAKVVFALSYMTKPDTLANRWASNYTERLLKEVAYSKWAKFEEEIFK